MATEPRSQRRERRPWLACAFFASLGLVAALGTDAAQTIALRNTAPGVRYVGSKACAPCHADIYREYMRTAMGRSMAPAGQAADFPRTPATVSFPKFHREYEAFRRGDAYFQSESEPGPGEAPVFADTHRISFVIGAGENGRSYVVRTGNYLFEAPLSFYSEAHAWGLSPGYELADYGFLRPVAEQCIACHSGRPRPVEGRAGLYRDPPFAELAIGCENCHGPGQLHVEERSRGASLRGGVDDSIVNPSHLAPWLADNLCMECHQAGDVRVLEPGKSYDDFRPGTPLAATVAIFAVPFTRASPPQSPLLQHDQLMVLSKCFRGSGGKLSCITCHDPHIEPTAAEAPTYFRQKCLSCHTLRSCTLALAKRRRTSPPDNCIACHMPRQNLRHIAHAALTDHRIVARPGEPFPAAAYHETTPSLTNLVYLDAAPGTNARLSAIVLFRAYAELSENHPEYMASYEKLLNRVASEDPHDPEVLSALARRTLKQETAASASSAQRKLGEAISAGSTLASDYELDAQLLDGAGDPREAATVLKKGIGVDPFSTRLYKRLTLELIKLHDYPDALAAMTQELQIYPEDSFMRGLISQVERSSPESEISPRNSH